MTAIPSHGASIVEDDRYDGDWQAWWDRRPPLHVSRAPFHELQVRLIERAMAFDRFVRKVEPSDVLRRAVIVQRTLWAQALYDDDAARQAREEWQRDRERLASLGPAARARREAEARGKAEARSAQGRADAAARRAWLEGAARAWVEGTRWVASPPRGLVGREAGRRRRRASLTVGRGRREVRRPG